MPPLHISIANGEVVLSSQRTYYKVPYESRITFRINKETIECDNNETVVETSLESQEEMWFFINYFVEGSFTHEGEIIRGERGDANFEIALD